MLRRVLIASAALAVALTGVTATAAEADAPVSTTTASGFDVSYPQCGSVLPAADDIAIVGVNAGTGTTTNPCLAQQLAWGDRVAVDGATGRADVYVNTANPGHLGDWWPTADLTRSSAPVVNAAGRCAGAEDAACAYVYGYSIGAADVANRAVTDAAARTWWLDVETVNSWSWDQQSNLAAIEGMVAAIRAAGADVGIYSTPRQWALVVGDATESVALAGAPGWIAGATSRAGAVANCSAAPLTPAGRVRMVQWVEHGRDHDVACGVGVRGTRPAIAGTPVVGSRLVAAPGAWGPSGVTLRYSWTRDGAPIPGATAPAYLPTAADAGTQVAVVVTGSRLGVPPLRLTSPAVSVTDPEAEHLAVTTYHALRFAH